MKSQPLNYEARIFFQGTEKSTDFDFYGESNDLATDHVRHCLWVENGQSIHYRKKGNVKWKVIINNEKSN